MLTIEPPFYRVRGVTVFRDEADADLYHYLPQSPRLARWQESNGSPRFALYKYRRDLTDNPELDPTRARGGGLALFEVELPVERLEELRAEVATRAGRPQIRLIPILFRSGTVNTILARSQADGLVEDLVESHKAPLTPPYRSAFAIALSPEGASLFEQAARGGDLPLGVVYDLRFLALTPSLHARVTMDYERIYDRFAASVGFTYYVSVKLDLDLAWLIENDFVKIEMTSFTDGEDAQRQRDLVLQLVKARIQGDFFRSGIPPRGQGDGGGALGELLGGLLGGSGEITSASAFFVLKARYEAVREQKRHELIFAGRTAIELPHVATGMLTTLVEGEDVELKIDEIELDDPFFSALDVHVSSVIDFESLPDLREGVVHLVHRAHRKSFSFRPGAAEAGRFQVPLTDPRGDEYSYEVEYHFDADLGGGPTRVTAGPFATRRRVLVIDPLEHLRYRRLRLVRGPVDAAGVPRLHVHLRVPAEEGREDDLARAELVLSEEQPEAVWRHRFPAAFAPVKVRARVDWEDAQGILHRGEEAEVEGETLVALGPYRGVLEIVVQPVADWSRIRQLVVELRYRDGDHFVEHQLRFDQQQAGSQGVRIALLDPARRSYDWRQTLFRVDGTAAEGNWTETDRGVLVVGRERAGSRQVRLVWVGSPGDALGLRVDFWIDREAGAEEQVSTFLRAGEGEARVTLPLGPEGRLAYRYEARRLSAGGEDVVQTGEGETDLLVLRVPG